MASSWGHPRPITSASSLALPLVRLCASRHRGVAVRAPRPGPAQPQEALLDVTAATSVVRPWTQWVRSLWGWMFYLMPKSLGLFSDRGLTSFLASCFLPQRPEGESGFYGLPRPGPCHRGG